MRADIVFRNDAKAKVTGRASYADDISFAGMLHAVPVYADYVAARDMRIDTSAALAHPGCIRVITAADVPGTACFGQIEKDYPILASDRVRSWGDVCALVVAESRQAARAAAALVVIQATPIKAVLTIDEALEPGAPIVPSYGDTNIVTHHKLRHGNPDPLFDGCELVLEEEFTTQAIEHAYMEPEAVVCVPRSDGVIEVYGSMRHPFSTRRFTAALLGEPLSNVEVYTISVGGGFGGKDDSAAAVCARAALAARLTGRPVKLRYDREWSFRETYKRHPYRLRYKVGVSSEGKVLAVKTTMHADSGPYLSVTPWVTWRSTAQCFGPYAIDNIHADVYGVATNNIFSGAMRGFGAPRLTLRLSSLWRWRHTASKYIPWACAV
ncbi:hypothetical protein MASR2M48_33020 [Spirochaetota bacterium]